ncbi:hypothetical protein HX049_08405 [Myroides odoratimimus]|uniref:hypothetical protein n=1 Tax=Myroides odoratimimus TaxID=76832 RepID=UPI0025777FE4|nr:hypothetical protein [Myroides odoratimimus]MDM1397194.1 hypothetical protein [Myroides odoratimimus]
MNKEEKNKLKKLVIESLYISTEEKIELINALDSKKSLVEIIDIFSVVIGIAKLGSLLLD